MQVKLVEVGKHDLRAGVGSRDGYTVSVGDAAGMIGKTVRVRIERFVDGTAYATLVSRAKPEAEPITAEGQAENRHGSRLPNGRLNQPRPTRSPRPRLLKPRRGPVAEEEVTATADAAEEEPKPKKKTRRGSRGGRGRKKKPATEAAAAPEDDGVVLRPEDPRPRAEPRRRNRRAGRDRAGLGEPATRKPKTARRRSHARRPGAAAEGGAQPAQEARRGQRQRWRSRGARTEEPEVAPAPASDEYVPMSELDRRGRRPLAKPRCSRAKGPRFYG